MKIALVDKSMHRCFLSFSSGIYKHNIYYRDTMSEVLKNILANRAAICRTSTIQPLMVIADDKPLASCLLAHVDRLPDILQIAFFEALPNQTEAVNALIAYARDYARSRGLATISVGLNLHDSYGLGLLANHYNTVQSFGETYNPPYYLDFFRPHAREEIRLINYVAELEHFSFADSQHISRRIESRYSARTADFRHVEKEVELYIELNNQAFATHPFHFPRRKSEELELFKTFRWLLRAENLLFLEHNGNPIGFMLWYPDFSQVMNPGEKVGIKTLIKSRLFSHRIKRFKIVELCVIPKYQKTGAVLALFHACHKYVSGKYSTCESGWILENNQLCIGFGLRWGDTPYKSFRVFLLDA